MQTNTPTGIDFDEAFEDLFRPSRYKVYYGGRGGGKSWMVARALLIKGLDRKIRVLCAREFQTSIADSVHKLLSEQIESLGLAPYYEVQKTRIIGLNGTEFIFKGLRHNVQEIKSTEGVDYCWCFVAGTKVDGANIENIRSGDYVKSYNHKTGEIERRKVLHVMKNIAPNKLYTLTFSGTSSIICTGYHPIFVKYKGYIPAMEIVKGDVVYAEKTGHTGESSLLGWLWGNDVNGHSRAKAKICQAGRRLLSGLREEDIVRADDEKQPDVKQGIKGKNDQEIKSYGTQTNCSRWEWKGLHSWAISTVEKIRSWMVGGIHYPNWALQGRKRSSNTFQGGFGKLLLRYSHRDRWWKSHRGDCERGGRSQNRVLAEQRVDSIKVQEKRVIGQLRGCYGWDYVYNLEVEGNNNYFANGLLVHNCEEAQSVSEESWAVLVPTIRQANSEIWMTFNPQDDDDPTYRKFVLNPPPNSVVRKVSWRDNPHFPKVLRDEMEYLCRVDPDAYAHVWEGETRTISDAVILRGKVEVRPFETPANVDRFYFGADWGFSQDPTVLIRCFVVDKTLYIDNEAYSIGCDIDKTPALFDRVPESRKWPIYADSARPETISYMRRAGFNISAAEKWGGSVEDGIASLRSFEKIVVHERCKHVAEEARLYKYRVDQRTGEVLPVVVDANNHCIDALRYSLVKLIRGFRKPLTVNSFTGEAYGNG